MKRMLAGSIAAIAMAGTALAQPSPAPHVAAARAAAGSQFMGVFNATCGPETPAPTAAPPARRTGPPPRSEWYAPPQKVFDNLYWLGTKEHSAWALTTNQGIILIDTLYAFAAEAEIVDGLKTLGLDPKAVKYVIVSHGHGDHDQGARMMQDRFGSHIVMGAADWDVVEKTPEMPGGGPPKRDIVVSAVQPLTLGDTTVTIVPTPGHTLGTLSLLFPVSDHGRKLTVAYSGGTAFNFAHTAERFDTYVASQQKMARAAADAKATVVLSNHSVFDHALEKAALSAQPRPAGKPGPFEVGAPAVAGYFKVLEECAIAARIKEFGR
jgi:metallo-beta-lactamase class B